MAAPDKTRIAVIGTGYLGRLHARVLTEMPEVEVVGFVEPSDTVADEVAKNLKLRRVASVAEIKNEIECAVVATPTIHHYEVARELIEAGCDVMIEKPITATLEDARRIIDLAAAHKRIIQVGHVERYNPAITAAAPVLDAPRYIESERLGVFVARSLDIDVLLDLMVHDLNLVLSFVKSKVKSVHAVGIPVLTKKVDMANVRLEFENGAVANLTASRVSSDRVRKTRMFGRDYYLSIDTKEQEVKGYRLVDAEQGRSIQPLELTVTKKEPLRAELEAFVECVRTRRQPLVGGEDGLAALELAVLVGRAIDESMKSWNV